MNEMYTTQNDTARVRHQASFVQERRPKDVQRWRRRSSKVLGDLRLLLIAAFVDIHNGFRVCAIKFDDARGTSSAASFRMYCDASACRTKGVRSTTTICLLLLGNECGSRCWRVDHFTLLALIKSLLERWRWFQAFPVTDLSEWVEQINRHKQLLEYALEHLETCLRHFR